VSTYQLHHGSNLDVLPTFDENSIDAIVTDPPYELAFMGKRWDASGIAYNEQLWRECLRVLKPGGHLLAFGGTRTYHRMTVAIEDAGFEIRDSIHWIYSSGFPKSLDVSKAIDKQRHDLEDIYKVTAWIRERRDIAGVTNRDIDDAFGFSGMAGHWTSQKSQPAVPTLEQIPRLLETLKMTLDDVDDEIRQLLWELNGRKGQPGQNWFKREAVGTASVPVGHAFAGRTYGGDSSSIEIDITAPATAEAQAWEGWGTALKPAHEPIVLARKPLAGTVANSVQQYGTGALNIDGTRIDEHNYTTTDETMSRWPSNVLIGERLAEKHPEWSNYFFCAKPSKKERNGGLQDINLHPTVKPLALMRYLVRLITPPHGTVLDPFAGSGTTLAAAIIENKNAIGIELTEDYLPLIESRCYWAMHNNTPTLFDN
jgi:DNA modification methylase